MKIMLCGKGGCGKSTIATLLSNAMKSLEYKVLLVDADESNIGVGRLMGAEEPASLLDGMGGKKDLQQKMMASFTEGTSLTLFEEKWGIGDIPEKCLSQAGGIRFMAIGKIHHFGEGCACPMGGLAKNFLINLGTAADEVVLIDAEAGVEHFGRGVEAGCDMVLAIVDPTYESYLLSQKIAELSANAQKDCYFVLNKAADAVIETMSGRLDREKIIAAVPQDDTLFIESLEGRPLTARIPEIDRIARFIHQAKREQVPAADPA